jgi:hypothetical protein
MPDVFIGYRHADAQGHAGRLHDSLKRRKAISVFRDIDLRPGEDFQAEIELALRRCAALIVVIGPNWHLSADDAGRPRLSDPRDMVRREIATALRLRLRVVPVLVEGASMPRGADLPMDIRALTNIQAAPLRDLSWDDDVDRLVRALGAGRSSAPASRYAMVGAAALAVVGAAIGGWALTHGEAALPEVASAAASAPIAERTESGLARTRVYVHTSQQRDVGEIESLANDLRASGYVVPATRLTAVVSTGDVRYFFPEDRESAGRVKEQVEAALGRQGHRLTLRLLERDASRFAHARPGNVELWLPPLRRPSAP